MMDVIDGDIAKYIWGFFLEFDDENTIPSTPMETSSISSGTESAMNNKNDNGNDNIYSLNDSILACRQYILLQRLR